MPELTPQQKAQLDKNIKAMLSQGASEQDVISYATDFRARFDVKKKWDDFVQSDIFLFVFGIVLMAIVMKLGSFVLYKMFPNQVPRGGGGGSIR